MTSKERMIAAMRNQQPDVVPVAPDMSNMIPCRLTGKPFWDIYLYQDPPLWRAYIDAVRTFHFDGWLGLYFAFFFRDEEFEQEEWTRVIVKRTDERIITRAYREGANGAREWSPTIDVYYIDNSSTHGLDARKLGLDGEPTEWEEIEGVREHPRGLELWKEIYDYMGDDGVLGMTVSCPSLRRDEEQIIRYFEDHASVKAWAEQVEENMIERTHQILSVQDPRPDFILIGNSGMMTFQSPAIFRDLSLSTLKRVTKMAKDADMPTQIHCCGPERTLVEIAANETDLDSINPLEPPPMGDCILSEIKQSFGHRLSLMGNLHTTDVMLRGTPDEVESAAKQAMDDAAEGGGFILSTGDQCGRDTPDENIHRLVDVARTYGRY